MNFSQRIAYIRFARHLTQEALASKLGVTPQAISKWETGMSTPDFELLPRIAEALDISLDVLFGLLPFVETPAEDTTDPTVPETQRTQSASVSFHIETDDRSDHEEADLDLDLNLDLDDDEDTLHPHKHPKHPNKNPDAAQEERTRNTYSTGNGNTVERNGHLPAHNLRCIDFKLYGSVQLELHPVEDSDKILWYYTGSPIHAQALQVQAEGTRLCIQNGDSKAYWGNLLSFRKMQTQTLKLFIPSQQLFELEGYFMGSTSCTSDCEHPLVNLECNGGNTLHFNEIGTAEFSLNGGNTVTIQKQTGALELQSRGAATLKLQDKTGSLKLHSQGSSSTKIANGHLSQLDLRLTGSGSFIGTTLEVDELSLRCAGVSTVVLDHVHRIRQSRTGKASTLSIRKTGE